MDRARISTAAAVLGMLLAAGFVSPSPSRATDGDGHGLNHRKSTLDQRIDSHKVDLDEISVRLVKAQGRLDAAVQDLADARAELSRLRAEVRRAEARDQQMQERLDQAIVRLENAEADLAQGVIDVRTTRGELAGYALSSYQSAGPDSFSLGVALTADTTEEALDGLQTSESVLDKQSVVLQELEATKVLLQLTAARVKETKDEVAVRRQEAADTLETKRSLEDQARSAKDDVKARVERLTLMRREIAAAREAEVARIQRLESERARVEERLRKIAERRAREHKAQLHRFTDNGGGFLAYPVMNTYITSPYGMRMHPILHVYKLHDGTDFHAACGTPVYAPADGRVMSEYYNAGYGNRIIVDHGYVKGVSLWTSVNHLSEFVAPTGAHVKQGQLIAYSGTTGYSTGCHLHFMVYVNGYTVDPVGWL